MNNRVKTPGILRYTCRGNKVITGSGKKLDISPVKVQASDLIARRNRVIRPIATSREEFSTATLSNTGFKAMVTPSTKHLQKYVDGFCFMYNNRGNSLMFDKLVSHTV